MQDSFTVASASTGVSGLGGRYATALYELADESRALDAVAEDLRSLRAMLDGSPDLVRLIRSPALSRDEQGRAIAALAERAGFSTITRNLLGLLAKNRRLFVLPAVAAGFLAILAGRRGEVVADVTTAVPLNDAQRAALGEALRGVAGATRVSLAERVDPAVLGGLVVRIGSRLVDASLRTKLQRLKLAMKGVG